MLAARWIAIAFALAAIGCGGDDSKSASGDAGANCPDLGGTWTIARHCSSALVGTPVTIEQNECSVTTSGAFPGFTGEIGKDGSFSLMGSASGMAVSCTGSATASTIGESCSGNCEVNLTR